MVPRREKKGYNSGVLLIVSLIAEVSLFSPAVENGTEALSRYTSTKSPLATLNDTGGQRKTTRVIISWKPGTATTGLFEQSKQAGKINCGALLGLGFPMVGFLAWPIEPRALFPAAHADSAHPTRTFFFFIFCFVLVLPLGLLVAGPLFLWHAVFSMAGLANDQAVHDGLRSRFDIRLQVGDLNDKI
ncbi:hypothetical protein GGI42DRAFT_117894 [Trichoderma sp. SZMC 28013]